MSVQDKISKKFRGIQGGLFEKVSKADVGTALNDLIANGAALMCWADPFYPDPAIPEHVKRATLAGLEDGTSAHYTMPIGNMELKMELAKKLKAFNHLDVMVPDPSYPNNFLNARILGGVTVPVPLREENGYQLEIEEFEKRLTPNTKMIVLTNPNNPTTTVMRRESLEKLAQFAVKNDLIVVCDQAFEDSVYDGVEFVTLASLPGMWERTVTVCSISKGMALSGYRVAYIVADDHIMDVYYGSAVSVIGATNTASQLGAIAALKDASFLEEYNRIFDRRRKIVYEIFNSIPGVSMAMPESTFLCWVNVSRLGTADEVNAYIIKEANVVVNAGTPYGAQGEGHLRIVFGAFREDAQMVTALERVKAALMKLGKEKGVS